MTAHDLTFHRPGEYHGSCDACRQEREQPPQSETPETDAAAFKVAVENLGYDMVYRKVVDIHWLFSIKFISALSVLSAHDPLLPPL